MYPPPEGGPVRTRSESGPQKVDVVCGALLKAMESMDPQKSVILLLQLHLCEKQLRNMPVLFCAGSVCPF